MAGVRDPAFWKRFSVAVHMDEEQGEKRGPQYKDEYVYHLPICHDTSNPNLTPNLQRLLASTPTKQEEEPHNSVLGFLVVFLHLRSRGRRRHHLVGGERGSLKYR